MLFSTARKRCSPASRSSTNLNLCVGTMLFRCSKSMILNAGKIDYVLPSLSGRFEAVLDNDEKVILSRQYVSTLKRLLGR